MKRLYAIVGHPVARSLSPVIHHAAFAAVGLPHAYVPVDVQPGALGEGLELLRTLGVSGANVTAPHKIAVAGFVSRVHGDAEVVGAVNTLVLEGQRIEGYLTDGAGFVDALAASGHTPESATILGAGGSARAVAYALARTGVQVRVCARRPDQADEVAGLHEDISSGSWDDPPSNDLVVNATSARKGLPSVSLTERTIVVDLVYGEETEMLARARTVGAHAFDGRGMLLHQAAHSFRIWTGLDAPIEAMRAALDAALRPISPVAGS